jgi:hypothetical protein
MYLHNLFSLVCPCFNFPVLMRVFSGDSGPAASRNIMTIHGEKDVTQIYGLCVIHMLVSAVECPNDC